MRFHFFFTIALLFSTSQSPSAVIYLAEVSHSCIPSGRTPRWPPPYPVPTEGRAVGCMFEFSRPRRGTWWQRHNGLPCGPRESARGRIGNGRRREKVKSVRWEDSGTGQEDIDPRALRVDVRLTAFTALLPRSAANCLATTCSNWEILVKYLTLIRER